MALQRAEAEGIPAYHLSANKSGNEESLGNGDFRYISQI